MKTIVLPLKIANRAITIFFFNSSHFNISSLTQSFGLDGGHDETFEWVKVIDNVSNVQHCRQRSALLRKETNFKTEKNNVTFLLLWRAKKGKREAVQITTTQLYG